MNLIKYIYNTFILFMIISISYGFNAGCMDNGYQSWSPNFGSPACNYDHEATIQGDCFYADCNGCFPSECMEQNNESNCDYIGNNGSFRCSVSNQKCNIGNSLYLTEVECIENSGIWFSALYSNQGECLYSNEEECILNDGNWSLYLSENENDCILNDGVWFRNGVDDCGICDGNNSTCIDCNNISNGDAYQDVCGTCVAGNTSNINSFSIEMFETLIEEKLFQKEVPVYISDTGILNSLYIEIEYDTTYIDNINFIFGSNINSNNYQIEYNHLAGSNLNKVKTQFNLFYSPTYFNCSIYLDQEGCEPNQCSWNNLEDICERDQKQYNSECNGSKDEVFKLVLDSKATMIDEENILIAINSLELNEKDIEINEDWSFGRILIYNPSQCNDEKACNYNDTGLIPLGEDESSCEVPGHENWPGCDCEGNTFIDDCGLCNGTQDDGDTNGDFNICEIDCVIDGEVRDCNNDCFPANVIDEQGAKLDNCNICAEGNTGLIASEVEFDETGNLISYIGAYDCKGVCSGLAYIDGCDHCIDFSIGNEDCLESQINILGQINSTSVAIGDTISNSKIFHASIYMQNLPNSLEGIILGLSFDKDVLTLKNASLDPSIFGIQEYFSNGELQNSHNYYKQISDSSFLVAILKDTTNVPYVGDFGNILFLEFVPSGISTPQDSTLLEYNQLQINENSMTETKINSFSKTIYFGDCNGDWNGSQVDNDNDGFCSDVDLCEDSYLDNLAQWEVIGPDGCPIADSLSTISELNLIPTNFSISQNFPNPFNPTTSIQYTVPKYSNIEIDIIDIRGEIVNTLVNSFHQPGNYKIMWDGKNKQGLLSPSGIYFYKMDTGDFILVKKLVLLK